MYRRRLYGLAGILVLMSACRLAGAAEHPDHGAPAATQPQSRILYWWDPMLGPSSIRDHPGTSAMGMALVPVYASQVSAGPEVIIDPAVVQNMGIRTAKVTRGSLTQIIRAVGTIELPEPGMQDVSLRISGWIDKLYANQDGMEVHQGEPLLALYSPQLQIAEQELISAVQARGKVPATARDDLKQPSDELVASARHKLELWDLDKREIDQIAKSPTPPRDVIFRSPAMGHVESKSVLEGSYVRAGERLMTIADHTRVWLDARIYEDQIPLIHLGETVEAATEAAPGQTFSGKITLIYPHVDPLTRTLTVRATLDSQNLTLKPGMYVRARIITPAIADGLLAPREAIIDTGTKKIAFVAGEDGHFSARDVETGVHGDHDRVLILKGLTAGEEVVTSGQFLLDVQSRINQAIANMRGGHP